MSKQENLEANDQTAVDKTPEATNQGEKEERMSKTIMIRHDTPYPTYRRAGLVLGQDSQPFEVTEEQLATLQNDPHVVMHEFLELKKE